jgi:hypothetical protein
MAVVLTSQTSLAQLAGQKPGGCPERAGFTANQRAVVGGFALLGDSLDRTWFVRGADQTLVELMVSCAHSIRYQVCTDGLIFGLLDPVGAAAGGAVGLAMNRNKPSLLGGLLGAGAGGLTWGIVETGRCNKRMEEQLKPAALKAFDDWEIDPNLLRPGDVQRRAADASRFGIIAPADAKALTDFADGAATLLQE